MMNMLELYLEKPADMTLRNSASLPSPKGDEVKIKLIYGGICGSDLRVFQGKVSYAAYPLRLGHELVGTIIETGENATYEIGTRVVVLPNSFCGTCDLCLKGRTNICPHKKSLGINLDGGFSEEFVISSKYILPVPDELSNEKAVLIEPLAVVVHAVKKVTITKDSSVAIVGCGGEGLLAASLVYHLGAQVTVIDINPNKLNLVRNIGDVRFANPQDVTDEAFDIVIEAAGVKNSVEQAVQLVKSGGSMIIIGLTQEANFPVVQIVRKELNIHGAIIYNFPDDYLDTIEFLKDPGFNVNPIISKIMPVTEYKEAFENALSGNYGKIILDFKEVQRV